MNLRILSLLLISASEICSSHKSRSEDDKKKVWHEYKSKFSKQYKDSKKEQECFETFLRRNQKMEEHNQLFKSGKVSYEKRWNKFSDMSDSERGSLLMLQTPFVQSESVPEEEILEEIPNAFASSDFSNTSFNWAKLGAVTPVKDQKSCGGCFAFSATGALEAQLFFKTGQLISLSEQQLLECAVGQIYPNYGCGGGWMPYCFNYVRDHGISKQESYPYTAKDTLKCDPSKIKPIFRCTGVGYPPKYNEIELINYVRTIGPICIAVDASLIFSYSRGVFDTPDTCNNINHGMLIVGYGTENGIDYWIVKNTWGPDWGENGYIRFIRNKNLCNIATWTSYPICN